MPSLLPLYKLSSKERDVNTFSNSPYLLYILNKKSHSFTFLGDMFEKQEIVIRQSKVQTGRKAFSDILAYEPQHIEEQALGNLYILSEQKELEEDLASLPNLINSTIKRNFYKTPHLGMKKSLQNALEEANRLIKEAALRKNEVSFLKKISYLILVVKEDRVRLASSGKNSAYLNRDHQLINLNEQMVPPPEKRLAEKFFQSSISGELEEKDRLILADSSLASLIDEKGLKQILKEENLADVQAAIRKIVRQEKKVTALAVLLFEYRQTEKGKEKTEAVGESKEPLAPPIDLWEILK